MLNNYTSPVDPSTSEILANGWYDATGFAVKYHTSAVAWAYHTGLDLNLARDGDAHKPVFAIADGVVTAVRKYSTWGWIIVIHHTPAGGPYVYARYAHVESIRVAEGQTVKRGDQIAQVGNANGVQPYHLHFDVSGTDVLLLNPAHWPGLNRDEVIEHYLDGARFLRGEIKISQPDPAKLLTVYTTDRLRIRALPSTASTTLMILEANTGVLVTDYNAGWYRRAAGGYIAKAYTTTIKPPPPSWRPPIATGWRGVHASAGGWSPQDNELDLVRRNSVKFALIAAYEPNQQGAISRLRGAGVTQFIIRACVHGLDAIAPMSFINLTLPILEQYASALGGTNGMMIAIANEPNLSQEGWGKHWKNGTEFAAWWRVIADVYRREFYGCKLGFPAMSPGGGVPGIRTDEAVFINQAWVAIRDADWIGVHYYWERDDGSDINPPVSRWKSWFGAKPIIATEVGPSDHTQITSEAVRKAYEAFARIDVPMTAWISNGAGMWQNAEWVSHDIRV